MRSLFEDSAHRGAVTGADLTEALRAFTRRSARGRKHGTAPARTPRSGPPLRRFARRGRRLDDQNAPALGLDCRRRDRRRRDPRQPSSRSSRGPGPARLAARPSSSAVSWSTKVPSAGGPRGRAGLDQLTADGGPRVRSAAGHRGPSRTPPLVGDKSPLRRVSTLLESTLSRMQWEDAWYCVARLLRRVGCPKSRPGGGAEGHRLVEAVSCLVGTALPENVAGEPQATATPGPL